MSETIVAKGKLFELVQTEQPDGRVFEVARRAPGVRLIIEDEENRILITKEYREELGAWDYRLPGGKVFDSLDEFEKHRASGVDILEPAKSQAIHEGREEAGIDIEELELFKKSVLGATVQWDLFVFHVTSWKKHANGQQLEAGEQIEADDWYTYDEIERMILEGDMSEGRIALILLQWIKRSK